LVCPLRQRNPIVTRGFIPLCQQIWIQGMDQPTGLFASVYVESLRNEILAQASGLGAHSSAYAVWKDLCCKHATNLFQSGDLMIKFMQIPADVWPNP
jgi:hypothetical protein